jgi:hypothetical protein
MGTETAGTPVGHPPPATVTIIRSGSMAAGLGD